FWLSTEPPDYFPLVSTLWWFQWRLWGNDPTGYHFVNFALHIAAAVILWRALVRLNVALPWLCAAIFAVHPVNVESASWIAEGKNTLSLALAAASLLLFLRFDETDRRAWLFCSLAAYTLALLAKTSVTPLPIALALLIWWR